MPVTIAKPATTPTQEPGQAPPPPQKISVVLRLYERYVKDNILYKRGTIYVVGSEYARKLLNDRDEHDKPVFGRYVQPKVSAQKPQVTPNVLPEVDLTDPTQRLRAQAKEQRQSEMQRRDVTEASDENFSESLHDDNSDEGLEEVEV